MKPFLADAAWLEDFATLNALHLDEASGEYRDWGRHTGEVAPGPGLGGWLGDGWSCTVAWPCTRLLLY